MKTNNNFPLKIYHYEYIIALRLRVCLDTVYFTKITIDKSKKLVEIVQWDP